MQLQPAVRCGLLCVALALALALASCVTVTGTDDEGVGGQALTCAESTVDVGCRCSIGPVINQEVLEHCDPGAVDAPPDTNTVCCEDRLIVNGKDEGVYLCTCTAIRCIASADGCRCDKDVNDELAQGEELVGSCAEIVEELGLTCCASSDYCSCSVTTSCAGSYTEVDSCEPSSLCLDEIDRSPTEACH